MNKKIMPLLVILLAFTFATINSSNAGVVTTYSFSSTDTFSDQSLVYFFDLRDRETYIQLSYFENIVQGLSGNMHIQIFDVSNNCNENDFFDVYTPNDTHIYNMRDIQTNDGNPSGVVLPDGAYGFVTVVYSPVVLARFSVALFGNMRIIDNNGYEYRTNAQSIVGGPSTTSPDADDFFTFNFNQEEGIIFSDVIGINLFEVDIDDLIFEFAADPLTAFTAFDVDIYNLNEVPFSCRDVIFSCVNQDSVLLEPLLELAGTASVADFEYGINDAIPHSRGGELLCPGNNITDGFVVLRPEPQDQSGAEYLFYIGLNNGNERGSFDSIWAYYDQNVNSSDSG